MTPSENATEPDYDVYDTPASVSVDDEAMQEQYEEESSVFNPEEESTCIQTLQDSAPAGRQTSLGRGYKPNELHWQEENEIARRERLRQNLQKQISEEATGTVSTSLGNRLTKQGSCEYHGGAPSLDLDYEYDDPEHIGFYPMDDADTYLSLIHI